MVAPEATAAVATAAEVKAEVMAAAAKEVATAAVG